MVKSVRRILLVAMPNGGIKCIIRGLVGISSRFLLTVVPITLMDPTGSLGRSIRLPTSF